MLESTKRKFSRNNLIIHTLDKPWIPHPVKAIVFAGGDIFNDYFFPKIEQIFNASCKLSVKPPIYAVSVGISHSSTLKNVILNQFDFISFRTLSVRR